MQLQRTKAQVEVQAAKLEDKIGRQEMVVKAAMAAQAQKVRACGAGERLEKGSIRWPLSHQHSFAPPCADTDGAVFSAFLLTGGLPLPCFAGEGGSIRRAQGG